MISIIMQLVSANPSAIKSQTTSKKRPPSSVEATASSQKNRGARSRLNMPESVNYNVSIRVSDGVQPN